MNRIRTPSLFRVDRRSISAHQRILAVLNASVPVAPTHKLRLDWPETAWQMDASSRSRLMASIHPSPGSQCRSALSASLGANSCSSERSSVAPVLARCRFRLCVKSSAKNCTRDTAFVPNGSQRRRGQEGSGHRQGPMRSQGMSDHQVALAACISECPAPQRWLRCNSPQSVVVTRLKFAIRYHDLPSIFLRRVRRCSRIRSPAKSYHCPTH